MKLLRLYIALICCLLGNTVLFAQTQPPFAQINMANRSMADDPDRALSLIQDALQVSFEQNDKRGQAYCYNSLGALNYQLLRYDNAIVNYQKAIPIFKQIKDEEGLYNSEKYLAISVDGKGDIDQALALYIQLLEKIQKLKKTDDEIDIRKRMSRIYQLKKERGKAEFQLQCISGLEEKRGNDAGFIDNLNSIGTYNFQQQDTVKAIQNYEDAIIQSEQNGYLTQNQQSYENLSNVYRSKRDIKKELSTRNAADKSYKKLRNKRGQASNQLEIGKLYLAEGKAEEAIPYLQATIDLTNELGELEGIEILYNNGIGRIASDSIFIDSSETTATKTEKKIILPDLSDNSIQSDLRNTIEVEVPDSIPPISTFYNSTEKENQTQIQLEAYGNLAKAYEQKGELAAALENYKRAAGLADSLAKLRAASLQNALDLNGKLADRDAEILRMQQDEALREADLREQRNISWVLLVGVCLLLIGGFFIMRNYRAKQRANKLLALRSLRSQMNPHFIFNSLNSINSFISRNDERAANRYLSSFSRLMRTVMEHSSHDFVPLTAELQVLELYLQLEHFRFQDKFDYEFEVDPTIQAEQIEVPPMLIQPYIENAIWHGLRYKEQKGMLRVSFRQDGNRLIGIVEDDGIGRARSQALKTKNQRSHKSTGLKNTAQRVELINSLYGKGVSVEITDCETEMEDCGTRVEIVIPYQEVV